MLADLREKLDQTKYCKCKLSFLADYVTISQAAYSALRVEGAVKGQMPCYFKIYHT